MATRLKTGCGWHLFLRQVDLLKPYKSLLLKTVLMNVIMLNLANLLYAKYTSSSFQQNIASWTFHQTLLLFLSFFNLCSFTSFSLHLPWALFIVSHALALCSFSPVSMLRDIDASTQEPQTLFPDLRPALNLGNYFTDYVFPYQMFWVILIFRSMHVLVFLC